MKSNTLKSFATRSTSALALAVILQGLTSPRAQANDHELLNQAVESSNEERAGAEHDYRVTSKNARASKSGEVHSVNIELGDELGSEKTHSRTPMPKHLASDTSFQDKGESKKLDREWKEVNRSMRDASLSASSNSSAKTHTNGRAAQGD